MRLNTCLENELGIEQENLKKIKITTKRMAHTIRGNCLLVILIS